MNSNRIYLVLYAVVLFSINLTKCAPIEDESPLEFGPGYNTYDHQKVKIAQMRGIKPIVDTIQEEEKYGNDGGIIRTASNTFIRITEGASASLSKAFGKPNENTYNLLKPFDSFLTDIGNRLGGLAK